MRVFLITSIMTFLCFAGNAVATDCLIQGKWKSNEEKTFRNMENVKLTAKQRSFFENNFNKEVAT